MITENRIEEIEKKLGMIARRVGVSISGGVSTFLALTDTPAAYDTGKYAKSTASGLVWDTPSATGAYIGDDTTADGSKHMHWGKATAVAGATTNVTISFTNSTSYNVVIIPVEFELSGYAYLGSTADEGDGLSPQAASLKSIRLGAKTATYFEFKFLKNF